ncbi:mannose-6-phosphate isomerase, class I [Bacillus pumilus]|nr:mannose-6-phosphate isomerase, class I [Bacillus pumilus]
MKQSPIVLLPELKERIWGGTALRDYFGYDIPSDQTGECWAISAHPNGTSVVQDGIYKGKTLIDLWDHHRELFGGIEGDRFPLLTKILDANEGLSVQVHPDDEYANRHENGELGKTECWYIIDCKEGAEMIYGHNARTRTELVTMMNSGDWEGLLRRVKIKPGEFYYVPSGTIHALCEGALVLETQQSSDTTYRVYDYERKDQDGHARELHYAQAIDVTNVPHVDGDADESVETRQGITIRTCVKAEYFSVYKWEIDQKVELSQDHPFLLCSVIKGEGSLAHDGVTYPLPKGVHLILPAEMGSFSIEGSCELIVSHI